MNNRRPAHVKPPAYLSKSPPVPKPEPIKPGQVKLPAEYGGKDGPEPTRYGDWEGKGICWDF
jgi:hypothetical protein